MKPSRSKQLGLAGVIICALLAIGLGMAAVRFTSQTNMDSYHSPNKVKIEIASQLSHSGLKYSKYVLEDGDKVWSLFQPFQANRAVTLECSSTAALPDDLIANQAVYIMPTPVAGQEIKINGVIAPYDCNLPLSKQNYRLTLEVVGAIDCGGGQERADGCVTRSIVQTAFEGVTYNPIINTPPPPVQTTQTTTTLKCPTGAFTPATEAIRQQIAAICAKEGVTIEEYNGPEVAPTITALPATTTTTTTTTPAPPSSSGSSGGATTKDNTVGM